MVIFIFGVFSEQSFALRIPMNTKEIQNRAEGIIDIPGRFMFLGDYTNRIIVLRNNIPGKPKGQITMRVCESSKLDQYEKADITEALSHWLRDYPDAKRGGVIHPESIKWIIDSLNYGTPASVYLAISDPDINGKDVIDVEGFVIVTHMRYRTIGNISKVVSWEIKPDNRDVLFDHWWILPKWLSRLLGIRTPKHKFRFIRGGRQLLAYAVWSELQRGCDQLTFELDDRQKLDKYKLSSFRPYNALELMRFIDDRNSETYNYLERAIKKGDRGAEYILRQIKEMSRDATTSNL